MRTLHLRMTAAGLVAGGWLLCGGIANAEPYLAIANGFKCGQCHVNPTGGGKRNLFGMTFARIQLAANTVLRDEGATGWNSSVTDWFGIGGDYRGGFKNVDLPRGPDTSETTTTRGTVYAEFKAVPNLLTVYFDQQLAPGESIERERYVLVTPLHGKLTVKAGQFFLPFGLRLQDDATFVRQRSGINFDTPDDGVELGLELPKWSAQIASTNGTAGAGSAPGKSQISLSASYVRPRWRAGASVNVNHDPLGDRNMQGVFGGFNTGPVTWLGELDFITDDRPAGGSDRQFASLLEADWRIAKGHNLKVGVEFLDPNDHTGGDHQQRMSVVWEYAPIQLTQVRVGVRSYDGPGAQPLTNRNETFAEVHVYF
ncbi:MAG TPA: hypothetical protein VHH11_01140 [Gammaproteobacteria bacterium]|nr:hypothetical protein [Gammaproteobacteria bacterium]